MTFQTYSKSLFEDSDLELADEKGITLSQNLDKLLHTDRRFLDEYNSNIQTNQIRNHDFNKIVKASPFSKDLPFGFTKTLKLESLAPNVYELSTASSLRKDDKDGLSPRPSSELDNKKMVRFCDERHKYRKFTAGVLKTGERSRFGGFGQKIDFKRFSNLSVRGREAEEMRTGKGKTPKTSKNQNKTEIKRNGSKIAGKANLFMQKLSMITRSIFFRHSTK